MSSSRTAPPVAVELGPEPAWRACVAVLWALTAAVGALWQGPQWALSAGPVFWGVCLGLALVAGSIGWHLACVRTGRLEWTGREWRLRYRIPPFARSAALTESQAAGPTGDAEPAAAQGCAPDVMIDLGDWMLLRLGVPGRSPWGLPSAHWVAVSRRGVGLPWHGLRVALYGARQAGSEG
jgi:hypothetical protein